MGCFLEAMLLSLLVLLQRSGAVWSERSVVTNVAVARVFLMQLCS